MFMNGLCNYIKPYAIRYLVNPIIWRVFGRSRRFVYYKKIRSQQWDGAEANIRIQKKQLYTLLQYALTHIPYYHDVAKKNRIVINEATVFDDIRRFPILTKKIIRENFERLQNPRIPSQKNTSGGSTGDQAVFMQTREMHDWDAAATSLFNAWAGRSEGEKLVKLWGSERDILQGGQGMKGLMVKTFMNEYLLNTFRLSDHDMVNYVRYINRAKPAIITAYVQSAYELSRFLERTNTEIYSPKGMIVSAGTLFPAFRESITKAFQCPVYNRYGSREVGAIACECDRHEGLHLNIFNHYLEILDNQQQPVQSEGGLGSLYITHLHNYAMPLIRYDIGDIGEHTNTTCSCGRGVPLMKHVQGRAGSILRTKDAVIDSTALTTSFYYFSSVKQYQVVQRGEKFTIRVVISNPTQWERDKVALAKKLHAILGSDTQIDFAVVDYIAPTKSGKFLFIINENDFAPGSQPTTEPDR